MKRALKISLSFWLCLFCAIALVRSALVGPDAPGPPHSEDDAIVGLHSDS